MILAAFHILTKAAPMRGLFYALSEHLPRIVLEIVYVARRTRRRPK